MGIKESRNKAIEEIVYAITIISNAGTDREIKKSLLNYEQQKKGIQEYGIDPTPYDAVVKRIGEEMQAGDAFVKNICNSVDKAIEELDSGRPIQLDRVISVKFPNRHGGTTKLDIQKKR
jgi:hypothetical protein